MTATYDWTPTEVAQAIRICEVYASSTYAQQVLDTETIADELDYTIRAAWLAESAISHADTIVDKRPDRDDYCRRERDAEAAQQLREGWLP